MKQVCGRSIRWYFRSRKEVLIARTSVLNYPGTSSPGQVPRTSRTVAIQNARLYERAEISAAELELRLAELRQAQKALEESESRSRRTGHE
jgi:hypothetical protein